MVSNFARLDLNQDSTLRLLQGQIINLNDLLPQIYRVYDHQEQFFGLAEFFPGKGLIAKRLCVLSK
jgi:Pseudouridine synthase II TruB, C-terminal